MEYEAVTTAEIVGSLEDIIEELKSGGYPSVSLVQSIILGQRRVSRDIFEDYQAGKQIMIIMKQAVADGD